MVIVRKKKKSRKTTLSTESEKTLNMCKTCTAQQITGFSHSPEGLYKKISKQGHRTYIKRQ